MGGKDVLPSCNDSRECFAKYRTYGHRNKCTILDCTYADGKCPFCKRRRDETNGKFYPYVPRH